MNYDTLPTIVVGVVLLFAIQGVTIYSVTQLLITGRRLFEKREQEPEHRRVVSLHDRTSER